MSIELQGFFSYNISYQHLSLRSVGLSSLTTTNVTQKEEIMVSNSENQKLVELVRHMKWHWSLENVSATSVGERWCVFDTDTGKTLSDAGSPEEAIICALEPQRYLPKYLVEENKYPAV
jgi:hypothetical protein